MTSEKPSATYFLLTCMDFRHMNDIVAQMEKTILPELEATSPVKLPNELEREEGTSDLYDHFVLAGASLSLVHGTFGAGWAKTFWDHVAVARKLHPKIHTVIILEHEDCGAYMETYGETLYKERAHALHERASSEAQRRIELETGLRVARWILEHDSSCNHAENRWAWKATRL